MISIFIENVLILAIRWAFSVTSWGRTPKHNKDVGGVDDSHHLRFLGLDVILDENKKSSLFEKDCDRMGIRAIWEGDHYHLQPKDLPHIV
jgi:hypothetical protein